MAVFRLIFFTSLLSRDKDHIWGENNSDSLCECNSVSKFTHFINLAFSVLILKCLCLLGVSQLVLMFSVCFLQGLGGGEIYICLDVLKAIILVVSSWIIHIE